VVATGTPRTAMACPDLSCLPALVGQKDDE
jgi:hypothetical protein